MGIFFIHQPLVAQGGRYSVGAVGAAVTDWLLFLVLEAVTVPPVAAQMAARLGGGLFSFIVNKHWAFQAGASRRLPREIRFFLLVYLASYGLNIVLFHGAVMGLGYSAYGAKVVVDILCFVFNFIMMRGYVFRHPPAVGLGGMQP